jgi:NADPH:quinone reductase-like Zn-dependent oxidoreductase
MVPVALCTAVYGLIHLAHVKKGDRVLIQSATGGLGLAAIQVAKFFGARVFTSVGSADKAQYLVSWPACVLRWHWPHHRNH